MSPRSRPSRPGALVVSAVYAALSAFSFWACPPPPEVAAADAGSPGPADGGGLDAGTPADSGVPLPPPPALGARLDPSSEAAAFHVFSKNATRMQLELFAAPSGEPARLTVPMAKGPHDIFSAEVPLAAIQAAGIPGTVFYGYRAFGPNWPWTEEWVPGSTVGFISDVDALGNRFNPNKLLLDPYAREVSHDPATPGHLDYSVYATGAQHRAKDSASAAPKAILLSHGGGAEAGAFPDRPVRALKDDIVYEVHLRGLTKNDPTIDAQCRGTYAAAAQKAEYLSTLGVTVVELLPIHETQNDTNDLQPGTSGDNYWGYSTLAFFAPDRRYACDQSPGGPTREFQEMVRAFHARGLKVWIDVVYNHTSEGGTWGTQDTAATLSWRGLDNSSYYQLKSGGGGYVDNNGVGPNLNAVNPAARQMVLDSLRYWHEVMGVDGFRFDLASVLGNACFADCFQFDRDDPGNILNRAQAELPVRPPEGGPASISSPSPGASVTAPTSWGTTPPAGRSGTVSSAISSGACRTNRRRPG
jgi:isoamylase